MRPIVLFSSFILMATIAAHAAEPVNDAGAVQLLDRMSTVIGDLSSCRYTLTVSHDVVDQDHGPITKHAVHEVMMVGPDKMLVQSRLDDSHRGYWYNGKTITYYSYDENNYAIVKAPDSILETIDKIHNDYGVDFPATDFFYPTFVDDLIDHSDEIRYVGKKVVSCKNCFHILAKSKGQRTEIWIADDAFNLPVMYSIASGDDKGAPRYVATFSDWQLNPELPLVLFDFSPPRSAVEITLVPKSGQ